MLKFGEFNIFKPKHEILPPEVDDFEVKEKSTDELMKELMDYQARAEKIAAELIRRDLGGALSEDEKLLVVQTKEMREIAIPQEGEINNEISVEEFDNQRIEELEEIIASDDYKKRTLEYLEQAGVVKYKAGQVYFDMDKFESKEFSDNFYETRFGRKENAGKRGSKKEIYKIFSELKVVGLSGNFPKESEPQGLDEFAYNNSMEKVKNRFFDELKNEKIIEEKEGLTVFDVDKFKNFKFKHVLGTVDGKSIFSSRNVIYDFLKDLEVVSANDYLLAGEDKTNLKPIPLFNVVEKIEEAFDVEAIKNKKYYLNLWDIGNKEGGSSRIMWEKHKDFKTVSDEKINLKELYLGTKIFRDFDGKREGESLTVRNPKDGSRQKITYDWILENIGRTSGIEKGVHGFLQDNCPNLLKKGLLKNSDFEIQTSRGAAEIARKEFSPRDGKKFEVFTKKVRYFIAQKNNFIFGDKKIPTKNIKVAVLDNKTLGIISTVGSLEKLEYTIDMLSNDEILDKKALIYNKDKKDLTEIEKAESVVANRGDLEGKIKEFNFSSLISEKANESKEEYLKRASNILNYNHVKDVSEHLLSECKVSIHNLSWREQVWLSAAEHELRLQNRYDEFIDFTKKYGLDGLKTFLSCEQDIGGAVKLLEINKKLDQKNAEEIFHKYSKIQASAQSFEELMKNSEFLNNQKIDQDVKQKLKGNLYDAFISRATDILNTAYLIAQKGEGKADFYNGKEIKVTKIEDVIEALDVYEEFMEKMKGFFAEEGRYSFDYVDSTDQGEIKIHNFLVNDKETGENNYSTITLRGNGTNEHMKDFEYDGEARVNFLFSDEPIAMDISNKSRKEATTFRLDRECITFDETGKNVLSKDNARQGGRLSLDFGSIYEDSGRKNSVLGRVMSVGNAYVAAEKKQKAEFYHNKEAFYEDLGKADVFRQIVETMEDFIKSKYVNKLSIENRKSA